MIDRVRVSTEAADLAQELNRRYPELRMGRLYRLAATLSLRRNGMLEAAPEGIDSDTNRPCRVSDVFEIKREGRPVLFPTIVSLAAGRDLDEETVYEQVWWHIHLGMRELAELARPCSTTDDILGRILNELDLDPNAVALPAIVPDAGTIKVLVGHDQSDHDVYWYINDGRQVDNPHAAIVGLSGQGKTQFALDVLLQIAAHDSEITFTIFDYKGDLSDQGSRTRTALESQLGCTLINVGTDQIPVVPFRSREGLDPEQTALMKAELFGKLYSRIGTQQRLILRQALTDLLNADEAAGRPGFGFERLDQHLDVLYQNQGRKPDGLTEVASKLRLLRPFLEEGSVTETPLLSRRLLVRLNELPTDSLPTAFLTIDRLYEEMRQLPDAPRHRNLVALRHVIFIDEAHHYLPVKASPLTSIIREGRSKGIAVLLATQTVSDLAGAAGADYREFLSTVAFFRTNVSNVRQIRAMIPGRAQMAKKFADELAELDVGEMLFTRHLGPEDLLGQFVLQAVQFYNRRDT